MKLWEVLKALEENPKKKFKYENLDRIYTMGIDTVCGERFYELTAVNDKGDSINHLPSGGFYGNFTLDNDWTEVKTPVTWQEAIEAWAKGKIITCKAHGVSYMYGQNTESIVRYLILNGTWYIKD